MTLTGSPLRTITFAVAALVSQSWATPAGAATYLVGTGSGCTHQTLTAAVAAAAQGSPDGNTIILTRSLAYTQVAETIDTDRSLTITDGYANCLQAVGDMQKTELDGAGGTAAPVLTIKTRFADTRVLLDRLTVRNGDAAAGKSGGGIRFTGGGTLEVTRSLITRNTADFGGGIAVGDDLSRSRLVIGTGVSITSNTARQDGGGVHVKASTMDMTLPDSMIALNSADGITSGGTTTGGRGGGIMVATGSLSTVVKLASAGPGDVGVLYANRARHGGGAAIVAASYGAGGEIAVTGAGVAPRTGIIGNTATISGGGFYAVPGRANGGVPVPATITLGGFTIRENAAPEGAAAYLDAVDANADGGASLLFVQDTAGFCVRERACGEISRNDAWSDGQLTQGATIRVRNASRVVFGYMGPGTLVRGGVVMQGNRGGNLIHAGGSGSQVQLDNVLITGNTMSEDLIHHVSGGLSAFRLNSSTIAGNSIGAGHVITAYGDGEMESTIIWQPGKTTLQSAAGAIAVRSVLASEGASLGGGPEVRVGDPRFTDVERGDYTLRAASPAIDAGRTTSYIGSDIIGSPRDNDLPEVANLSGPRDIVAYELEALPPLMLNADFDTDLRLWTTVTAGVTTRDALNASGPTGSGSAKIAQTGAAYGQAIRGVRQCVHLPGPGTYAINGTGRGTGNITTGGDFAQLQWEYRRNGGESCTQGVATLSGFHTLSTTSNWARPSTPARVTVEPLEWTSNSSITVTLVAIESGVSTDPRTTNAWFDGVRVERVADDTLFRNGFD